MNSSSRSKGSNRSSPRLCPPPRHGGGGRFGSKKINLSNLLMLSNITYVLLCVVFGSSNMSLLTAGAPMQSGSIASTHRLQIGSAASQLNARKAKSCWQIFIGEAHTE